MKTNIALFVVVLLVVMPFIASRMVIQDTKDVGQSKKVLVSLYYESLCPGCQFVVRRKLCATYRLIGDYINVELVPYGNAETTVSNATGEITILCQHGPNECTGNRIQSCALKKLTYDMSIQYICCVETAASTEQSYQDCATQLGIEFKTLQDCANGPEGMKLLYLNGVKTDQLRPEHEYVPWVTLNGKYDKAAEENMFFEVCDRIPDPKPRNCNTVDYLYEE